MLCINVLKFINASIFKRSGISTNNFHEVLMIDRQARIDRTSMQVTGSLPY